MIYLLVMGKRCNFDNSITKPGNCEVVGQVSELLFQDPDHFVAGELHKHAPTWAEIAKLVPSSNQEEVLSWTDKKVSSIFRYFKHFKGRFKGEHYDPDQPPHRIFKNNASYKQFGKFVRKTLLSRLQTGAISFVGKVGQVKPPHLVLPLTVEPTKPRLFHGVRYLNLWMMEKPFSLDRVTDLPRYVFKDSYQTGGLDKGIWVLFSPCLGPSCCCQVVYALC